MLWTAIVLVSATALWLAFYPRTLHEDLLNAARNGDHVRACVLLVEGRDINQRGQFGETPLIQAVWGNHQWIVGLLVQRGAEIDAVDADGNSALIWAAAMGHYGCARVLIAKRARLDLQNREGNTALISAALNGFPSIAKWLVDAGANVNLSNVEGETALSKARQRGFDELAQLLMAHGAEAQMIALNKSPYPGSALSRPHAWALATTAVLVQYNGGSHELLGSVPLSLREKSRETLAGWWHVHNRDDALRTLSWLVNEGHRAEFEATRKRLATMTESNFTHYTAQVSSIRNATKLLVVWRHRYDVDPILAWDLCRHNWVAGEVYVAGYITEGEAWARIMPSARQLQKAYSSWEEMGHSYLEGREYWCGDRDPRFTRVLKLLANTTDPNSPWTKNKWDTDLSERRP